MELRRYSESMGQNKAFLTLKIDTEEPVEIGDFVGAFTSLANEFERYVASEYPGTKSDPRMYVREVRYGCIEADMITGLAIAASSGMDQILILEDFVKRWGARFLSLRSGKVPSGELESPAELKDWADAARSIASDPIAGHRLEAATFEDGKREVKATFRFTSPDARAALNTIEERREQLARLDTEVHQRVLMVFTRTDVHDAAINKQSGERVKIDQISNAAKPVMFASEMTEQEIRSVIREADENVYKKGFVVDVLAIKDGGKIRAYSVLAMHSVIDLSDED